ncbi:DUF885 domain-containing protein [Shewanella submarina]|uniref:DUF885 domain-containing protein n=1 Tax=Shewanella submarina TaxID=2016376 RepID=A0ABV7GD87_9GAMM|nr:DUF885 domain-containing protein [Shewanella submarina]MCL1036845.1 DUF885 domain-containing protein [Shewanella submarina]
MKTTKTLVAAALSALLLSACATAPSSTVSEPAREYTSAQIQAESARANELFEAIFMENVMASPITQTYLGIKQDYGKWDEISESARQQDLDRTKKHLAQLNTIDPEQLDHQTRISYSLAKQGLEDQIANFKWRHHSYPVNQMYGVHSTTPALLINQHAITSVEDAQAYISRLNGIDERFKQLIADLQLKADRGIIAPKFVFNHVLSDSKNIIQGAPFAEGEDSTLLADFKRKVGKLEISKAEKQQLIAQANEALLKSVEPAYTSLITYVESLQAKADTRDGVWKLPQGDEYYNMALAQTTTTDLTSEQIHQLGLKEVARIHDEMRAIMKKVGFKGDLQAFFAFMRDDPQFYYPDTQEGREAYIAKAKAYIDNMDSRLDEVFSIKPKANLIVKPVEAFREKSAGKAFYSQPSPDGSRPGTYYANMYDMKAMPTYQAEALAYHEGLPGHHMQIAIAQELEGIPKFRRFGRYTAYTEGWGLYTEYFPKEMGLYEDPYSDFGRLAMELWRACRLVVDTGIHSQKWTREQGIEYYVNNTPNAKSDAVKMVERHIVMPSQATAYKVGMIKILELRENAKASLGDQFDIREFHTLLLKNGPLPLDVLEEQIDLWVAEVKARQA